MTDIEPEKPDEESESPSKEAPRKGAKGNYRAKMTAKLAAQKKKIRVMAKAKPKAKAKK